MLQYLETKKDYPDTILFYRIGDFYEMFYQDAKTASEELDLVLTGKDCGTGERAPMCGIPFHAADSYVTRLVEKGYKVAIAEQMEDPKLAKGIVKREVIRVITPGTLTADTGLDERKNNFLMSVYYDGNGYGISSVDISTGEFLTTECGSGREVVDEISRFSPAEIVVNPEFGMSEVNEDDLKNRLNILFTVLPREDYDDERGRKLLTAHFHAGIEGLGLADRNLSRISAAAVLSYIYDTQKGSVSHISNIRFYLSSQYMIIDTATQRNLELTETLREKKKRGSLLWVLDKTRTAMGGRMLRRFLEQPLINRTEILKRQDAVAEFCERYIDREELSEYLNSIYDLERLLGRISYKSANPRDLLAFRQSLERLPDIKNILSGFKAPLLHTITEELDDLSDLYDLVNRAVVDDPPVSSREGGIIREEYSEEVKKYREARKNGKQWLLDLETSEREKTGIRTLKIKYNRIFGYCIEVTNTFRSQVPDYYIRKQTLANGERYTTDRLEEIQNSILGAEEKLNTLEFDLFCEIRDQIAGNVKRIQKTSHALALLDCLISLSRTATENNYIRPSINEEGRIEIHNGRHPVIEKLIDEGMFVANDTILDQKDSEIAIITGPNMAGKSTYMRQVALIVLMASIGSFVPAGYADICITDRIFTRVGASDDLASGQSTFMVEMNEVANILRNATKRSLLVLDEIGRGTSTFDGLSIAWAVVEYISVVVRAKTLFATHYHELTELEGKLAGVKNYCIAVTSEGNDIVFLRKILRGGADQSYGIDVARLAGVPGPVIERAKEISEELSGADILQKAKSIDSEKAFADNFERTSEKKEAPEDKDRSGAGKGLADAGEELSEGGAMAAARFLEKLDLNHLTPLDALNNLFILKEKLHDQSSQ